MQKLFMVLIWAVLCAGCATVPSSIVPVAAPLTPPERVTLGMTRSMVETIMAARVVVGYEIDPATGATKPVDAQNLFSSEIKVIQGTTYQVDWYVVRPPMAGTRIAEADLFPVIYRNGLVAAKGREGLAALAAPSTPPAVNARKSP